MCICPPLLDAMSDTSVCMPQCRHRGHSKPLHCLISRLSSSTPNSLPRARAEKVRCHLLYCAAPDNYNCVLCAMYKCLVTCMRGQSSGCNRMASSRWSSTSQARICLNLDTLQIRFVGMWVLKFFLLYQKVDKWNIHLYLRELC